MSTETDQGTDQSTEGTMRSSPIIQRSRSYHYMNGNTYLIRDIVHVQYEAMANDQIVHIVHTVCGEQHVIMPDWTRLVILPPKKSKSEYGI